LTPALAAIIAHARVIEFGRKGLPSFLQNTRSLSFMVRLSKSRSISLAFRYDANVRKAEGGRAIVRRLLSDFGCVNTYSPVFS
jgi:hypothetical protein